MFHNFCLKIFFKRFTKKAEERLLSCKVPCSRGLVSPFRTAMLLGVGMQAGHFLNALSMFPSIMLMTAHRQLNYDYPHFTEEEIEVGECYISHPQSNS